MWTKHKYLLSPCKKIKKIWDKYNIYQIKESVNEDSTFILDIHLVLGIEMTLTVHYHYSCALLCLRAAVDLQWFIHIFLIWSSLTYKKNHAVLRKLTSRIKKMLQIGRDNGILISHQKDKPKNPSICNMDETGGHKLSKISQT